MKKVKKRDVIDIVLRTLIILGIILITYWFFQLVFGSNSTLIEFVFGLVFVLISLVFHLYYKAGKFNEFVGGTVPRFEKNIEQSFTKIKEDMKSLKKDVGLIKKKLKI